MNSLLHDLRYAVRMLLKSPGLTAVIVVTLALGIGANAAIFSVIHAVLLNPLPYDKPDKLVMLWMRFTGIGLPKDQNAVSAPELMDLQRHAKSFSHIAAIGGADFNMRVGEQPERITGARVSSSFFSALGVRAQLGRVFLPEEEQLGRDNVVVIGDSLWKRRFASDAGVVGRALQIDGQSFRVAGVMPPGFEFPSNVEMWAPLAFSPEQLTPGARANHGLRVVARIRDDLSFERTQADLAVVSQRIIQGAPGYPYKGFGFRVLMNPLLDDLVGDMRPALLILMGAVAFVLLIACANVANLLLARASTRQQEIAIRAALGAGQGRLVRQLLTEGFVLSATGALAGLLFAQWMLSLLTAGTVPGLPRLSEAGLDLPVLGFTLLIAMATAVVFGLAPALQTVAGVGTSSLKEGGRGTQGTAPHRLKQALVVAEVALSLVLLAGAGLLVRSFARVLDVDPGFRGDRVLAMRISLPESRYSDPAKTRSFYDELRRRLTSLPGVQSAGFITALPLSGGGGSGTITLDTQSVTAEKASPEADRRNVTPGLFEALGFTLVRGRSFDERDTPTSQPVAIVDETMAKTFWPNQNAIGKRLKYGGAQSAQPWRIVVGVVRHVRYQTLESPSRVEVYLPYTQAPNRSLSLAVRTAGDPRALAETVRRQVLELDPDQPVYAVRTMQEVLGNAMAPRRLATMLLTVFAAVALLLVAVGIYGVISYSVEQRVREVGIRMALGASSGQVLGMVMRQSLVLIVSGIALGLVAGLALTRLMSTLLYDTKADDPATFGLVVLTLSVIAALASYLPARRACRVDPMTALRSE